MAEEKKEEKKEETKASEIEAKNKFGQKITSIAMKYVGFNYSENGDGSKAKGLRIGGISQEVFDKAGVKIYGDAARKTEPDHQFVYSVTQGKGRAFEDEGGLLAGDLIFFKGFDASKTTTEGDCNVSFVGVSIGNGEMVAVSKEKGVIKCSIDFFGKFTKIFVRIGNPDFELSDSAKPIPVGKLELKKDYSADQPCDSGCTRMVVGKDMVKLTTVPKSGAFSEPIYPDYVAVSDTIPVWVLHDSIKQNNDAEGQKEEAKKEKKAQNIPEEKTETKRMSKEEEDRLREEDYKAAEERIKKAKEEKKKKEEEAKKKAEEEAKKAQAK